MKTKEAKTKDGNYNWKKQNNNRRIEKVIKKLKSSKNIEQA